MKLSPVLLTVLDGWGLRDDNRDNPFSVAKTPNLNCLFDNYPNSKLNASGEGVGLPPGQMGNSEVGHMSMGAGRVIIQDLPKISAAIKDGRLEENIYLKAFLNKVQTSNKKCHIMGLLSDGGIHSHIEHFIWMAIFFARNECEVYIHAFLDGRDSLILSQGKYLKELSEITSRYPNIKLATICGRYYAMDRDQRWNRTELAFKAIFYGKGLRFNHYDSCLNYHYNLNITDEFIEPSIIGEFERIEDNDGIVMINFRADRIRQLLNAALIEEFKGFDVSNRPKVSVLGMTEYSQSLSEKMSILFRNKEQKNILGEVLERNNLKQLRVAETEKYAHVTFFFNSGRETPFKGEDRLLINSPLVDTYDIKPEMSAFEVTEKLIAILPNYDFILLNFANMDMVGHTGNFKAAVKAIEVVDECLGKIMEKILELQGHLVLTSDHGNIEIMREKSGLAHTQHTVNLVPIVLFSEKFKTMKLTGGTLADIAPTILTILNIDIPIEMTGNSLINLEKV